MRQQALTQIAPVIPVPENAAETYRGERSLLKAARQSIGNNDRAAHALTTHLVLVTNNEKEFPRIRGLEIGNWAKN